MRPEAVREGLSPRRREAESALDEEEGIVSFFPFSLSLVSAQLRLRFSSRPRRDGCPDRSPLVSGMRERGGSRAREEQRERERETSAALVFFCSLCSINNKKTLLSLSCTPRSSFLDASPAAVCFRLASNPCFPCPAPRERIGYGIQAAVALRRSGGEAGSALEERSAVLVVNIVLVSTSSASSSADRRRRALPRARPLRPGPRRFPHGPRHDLLGPRGDGAGHGGGPEVAYRFRRREQKRRPGDGREGGRPASRRPRAAVARLRRSALGRLGGRWVRCPAAPRASGEGDGGVAGRRRGLGDPPSSPASSGQLRRRRRGRRRSFLRGPRSSPRGARRGNEGRQRGVAAGGRARVSPVGGAPTRRRRRRRKRRRRGRAPSSAIAARSLLRSSRSLPARRRRRPGGPVPPGRPRPLHVGHHRPPEARPTHAPLPASAGGLPARGVGALRGRPRPQLPAVASRPRPRQRAGGPPGGRGGGGGGRGVLPGSGLGVAVPREERRRVFFLPRRGSSSFSLFFLFFSFFFSPFRAALLPPRLHLHGSSDDVFAPADGARIRKKKKREQRKRRRKQKRRRRPHAKRKDGEESASFPRRGRARCRGS